MNAGIVVIASLISAAVTYLLMLFLGKARGNLSSAEEIIRAKEESLNQRLLDKDEACRALIKNKEEACRAIIEAKTADCEKIIRDKNEQIEKLIEAKERAFAETVKTLREQFANIAEQKLKSSTEGLSEINQKRISEIIKPFQDEIDKFRQAFEANTQQQVVNKASFDQAITDLGKRAMQIGEDAENLARALKSESKTQGDWGEMILSNILQAAGLKAGTDFIEQAQECDEAGNRLIPDVEILLPNKEKLLIDSKVSVTAYLNYVASQDDTEKEKAIKEHIASVRKHMEELVGKDYIKKVQGSQGYILMFIPNEGSYLLAMEHDRKLATDAFKKHVIIVNPTTLLLCLQIVALLRSREAQNENAERISMAAAKMYEKFAGFSETFVEIGRRAKGLMDAYEKAYGQLCDGNGNVVRQLERLKDMGIVTAKTINPKLLDDSAE
jgi:DNA recombination protein RmuC